MFFRKAIIWAAAAVRCSSTITANVVNSLMSNAYKHGKPAAAAESVYLFFQIFSS